MGSTICIKNALSRENIISVLHEDEEYIRFDKRRRMDQGNRMRGETAYWCINASKGVKGINKYPWNITSALEMHYIKRRGEVYFGDTPSVVKLISGEAWITECPKKK